MYLYHYHNFEDVRVFDLEKELFRGETSYAIPGLFKIRPFKESLYDRTGPQHGARDLMRIVDQKGIEQGIKKFQEMKMEKRTVSRYVFEEWLMRSMGLNYLSRNQTETAREIFKLNVQLYPKSWQVYYDLAEVYRKTGNKKMAVENYQQALKLKPDKRKIFMILKKLKNKNF